MQSLYPACVRVGSATAFSFVNCCLSDYRRDCCSALVEALTVSKVVLCEITRSPFVCL